MKRATLIGALALAACDASGSQPAAPGVGKAEYLGVTTRLLDGTLVQFGARVGGVADAATAENYAQCAAAQYALIRGYGFARHLRTNVHEEAGIWTADAVYTVSPSLPRGLRTIDAEVVVAACAENGIPTV